jgi:hypothetical protein
LTIYEAPTKITSLIETLKTKVEPELFMIASGITASRARRVFYFSLCVIPAFVSTVLLLFAPGFNAPITAWQGYHVLLADGEADIDPVLDSLELAGVAHVSMRNTGVYLNIFSGIETVPLAVAADRLDIADPRFDPYIQASSKYFSADYRGKNWHVVYIKTNRSQLRLLGTLARSLGPLGIEYRLPEWRSAWIFGAPIMVYGFLLFLVRGRRRLWRLTFVLLPLAILSVRASGLGLAAAIILTPGWICLFEIFEEVLDGFLYNRKVIIKRSALFRSVCVFLAGLGCSLVLSAFHIDPPRYRGLIAMTLAALTAWTAGVFGLRVWRLARRGHKVFFGLQVLQGTAFANRRKSGRIYMVYGALLLAVFAAAPALILLSRVDSGLAVAEPADVRRPEEITSESLATLSNTKVAGRLPDLSDYVIHRAYQDSLLYERKWVYPEENGGIAVHRYRVEDGMVVVEESRVISFDSAWFDQVISDAAADGLGGMLISQGGDVAVRYRAADERPLLKLLQPVAVTTLVIIPLIFLWPSLTSTYFYGIRNLPLRRKRQTA